MSDIALDHFRNNSLTHRQRTNVSGYIRENQGIAIEKADLEYLDALRTPAVHDKALKLLIQVARTYPSPGDVFLLNYFILPNLLTKISSTSNDDFLEDKGFENVCKEALPLLSFAWAEDAGELSYLITEYLIKTVNCLKFTPPNGYMMITPNGWKILDGLRTPGSKSNIGFVAMWFDESVKAVWTKGIRIGIVDSGYDPLRIDGVEHNNHIDDAIIAAIRECKFLVADLTGGRGGVYFEAGFAKGLGKEVIWLCKADELGSVHFDTRQYNFILWSPDNLPKLAIDLKNRIEATLGKGLASK